MSEEFNTFLKNAYHQFKDDPDPPIPLELIKSYLEDEGIKVEEMAIMKVVDKDARKKRRKGSKPTSHR
jgi:hypothetical protein